LEKKRRKEKKRGEERKQLVAGAKQKPSGQRQVWAELGGMEGARLVGNCLVNGGWASRDACMENGRQQWRRPLPC
jgi:hypothetical protein